MKRIWFFLISAVLMLSAFGSRDTIASLDRAMVHAVGIDSSDEGFTVTLQVFRPEGAGSETQLDPAKANIFVISASAPTVGEAMTECEDRLGEFLFIGHDQIIVLGSETELTDAKRLFSYFIKSKESYLGAKVACAEGSAAELLSAELSEGAVSAQNIVNIIDRHLENSDTADCDLLAAIGAESSSIAMPVLKLVKAAPENDSGSGKSEMTVSAAGAQVFVNGKRSFRLSAEECSGLARLKGKCRRTVLSAEGHSGVSAVTVKDSGTDITLTENGGRLICRCSIGVTVGNDQSIELLFDKDELRRSCEEQITRSARRVIDLCYEHRADLLGLGDLIRSRFPGLWLSLDGDTDRIFDITDTEAVTECIIR